MSEKIINIQDAFLNYIRKNKIPVTVFLLNGVKLNGIISCFDQSTIVIKRDGYAQLIYKHAISTFSPHKTISVFDWNAASVTDTEKHNDEIDDIDVDLDVIAFEDDEIQDEED
jgi:host factor-I protein